MMTFPVNYSQCLAVLLLIITLSLTACGFSPLYAQNNVEAAPVPAFLSAIDIEIIPDREGQILRNHLIDRFYKTGYPDNAATTLSIASVTERKTELDLTKSSEATRAQLRIGTSITLTDKKSGKSLFNKGVSTITSYNILPSEFATRVAEENARQRALQDLARQIELALSLYASRS
jgi:LPS-assembly lipoprotein